MTRCRVKKSLSLIQACLNAAQLSATRAAIIAAMQQSPDVIAGPTINAARLNELCRCQPLPFTSSAPDLGAAALASILQAHGEGRLT